jgi:hypothetical protein
LAAALTVVFASGALAEITTEKSASILVFPKVISDGTKDTVIQITNTSNSMVHAHCFYVNGALTDPSRPAGPTNPPLWTEIDFDIWLTKQQPTYWVVSEGRLVDATDPPCSRTEDPPYDCPNTGIDPGRVPPVVEDFTGELKCIEVDASGAPLSGNHLKGEATLVTLDTCSVDSDDAGDVPDTCAVSRAACDNDDADCPGTDDIAKYNAIGVLGNENNNGDGVLCLGGTVGDSCPTGPEYNACPQTWILNHYAEGAVDPVLFDLEEDSSVSTDVTIVPCTENFETQAPTSVTVQFAITNEYEQTFSASTTVICWAEVNLADINPIFDVDFVGSDLLQTRMRPSTGTTAGFMVVADELHTWDDGENQAIATTAANVHNEGERPGPDLITIPADQVAAPQ